MDRRILIFGPGPWSWKRQIDRTRWCSPGWKGLTFGSRPEMNRWS